MVQTHFFLSWCLLWTTWVSLQLSSWSLKLLSSDSCLLDLKCMLSVGRKPGSSKSQGSLAMSAPSSFREEFGECTSDDVLQGQLQTPSRFSFFLPPTSKDKWHIAQKPFQKLSLEAEGVAHRKFPFCSKRLCSLTFWCYNQNHKILHVQVLSHMQNCTNEAMKTKSVGPAVKN